MKTCSRILPFEDEFSRSGRSWNILCYPTANITIRPAVRMAAPTSEIPDRRRVRSKSRPVSPSKIGIKTAPRRTGAALSMSLESSVCRDRHHLGSTASATRNSGVLTKPVNWPRMFCTAGLVKSVPVNPARSGTSNIST